MKNFVIIYSGRTGSSPIVNMLARQPGVCVPVFENLDERFVGTDQAENIPAILDKVFSSGVAEGTDLPIHLPRFPAGQTPRNIGFKWRPFGDWDRICEVFRRHEVVLFVLARRDFIEMTSSQYITRFANVLQNEIRISAHPQFAQVDPERGAERAAIDRLQSMTFPVRPWLLRRVMRHQARVRGDLVGLAGRAHRSGVPVRAIYYEDFTADNAAFIRGMLETIGRTDLRQINTESAFTKVMKVPARTRLPGLDSWLWLPPIMYEIGRYRRHGRNLEAIAAASKARRPVAGTAVL